MIYSAITFLLLLALVSVSAVEFHDYSSYTFERFESEFGKTYPDNVARNHARGNFLMNLHKIVAHNADHSQSYSMGVNKFTDLSKEDLVGRFTGYNKGMARSMLRTSKAEKFHATGAAIPAALDWRNAGCKVTPVKDQGGCGSCWAFSATATIESALAIQHDLLAVLAPQDVTMCTPNPQHCGGTGGCGGATAELAFEWAADGVALNEVLPYNPSNSTCYPNLKRFAKVDAYVKLDENNATALLEAVNTFGPISVSVAAGSWGSYSSGIFNGCGNDWDINHAVQLVGYGTDQGTDYWLVRNSWGSSWGEKGYIRLYRGPKEVCGTDKTPSDGSGCDGGPATVQVCGTCGIWYDNSVPTKVSLV